MTETQQIVEWLRERADERKGYKCPLLLRLMLAWNALFRPHSIAAATLEAVAFDIEHGEWRR